MGEIDNNEFILYERKVKIQNTVWKYGEDNFSISFSGGLDSCVLSALVDEAIPKNQIPRLYCDTGIELNMVRDFVYDLAKNDERIVILSPSVPIKQMLEEVGYPFKSKEHSLYVDVYQRNGFTKTAIRYLHPEKNRERYRCPQKLLYQFTDGGCSIKISDKCCDKLKKEPLEKWQKENGKPYAMTGIMKAEGGRRASKSSCLVFDRNRDLKKFQPLFPLTKEWEQWFIETHGVKICDIYKPPYNFQRTGCKGCPFALKLQNELDILEQYFPNERKQCEWIWKPVYDEYRRLGYRLKGEPLNGK